MSSILITSVPIHGHVIPLLEVARHLVARGDRVRVLTGARFADAVTAVGATHLALPEEADFDDRLDLHERFPERAALRGSRAIAFDVEHIFVRPARGQYEAVMAAHDAEPVDVILSEPAFAGAAFVLGHPASARPAVVVAGVLPLMLQTDDVAPYGLGLAPARWGNRARNRTLARLTGRVFTAGQRLADETNRAVHGVPLPFPVLNWVARADAIAQCTVPAFEYPRPGAPTPVHFVGPITPATSSAERPAWWSDLDGSRPVVHVTQGTIANKDYGQLIAPALAALAAEDVLVVVTTGGRPLETLPPLPPNARAATYLDYEELLPRTDLVVTNGGYGGVHAAMRHGVPIVATGGKEDKPEVGARVAWSGVGVRIRSERPSPRAIRRAVRTALGGDRYGDAVRGMAGHIAAAPGLGGLAAVIDGCTGGSGAPSPPLEMQPSMR